MKNLYIVHQKTDSYGKIILKLLQTSCRARNITIFLIDPATFDFSVHKKLTAEDGLYRIAKGSSAALIEKFLIRSQVNTFYLNELHCLGRIYTIEATLFLEKSQLPIIPTIFSITTDQQLLKKYVEALGGFPLIIKSAGKCHGEGVMKINSWDELNLTIKQLMDRNELCIMRKYIPHKRQGRLIVLGDKVIASHENIPTVDFRSNVGSNDERQRRVMPYDQEIQEIAVKAVNVLGYEFGGVDILFHEETDEPYLAEVNMPCFFATTQQMTGADISGMMVDYLIDKSRKKPKL